MGRMALESDNLLLFWKHPFKSSLEELPAEVAFLSHSHESTCVFITESAFF